MMKKETTNTLPPTKIAVLIDGGFFLKRFNALYNKDRSLTAEEIADSMHSMEIRQKGIDMKIGVDIASLALKKHVDTIILVAGDADFVPAAKLARREGIDFILHPMAAHIDPDLFEHIDGLYSNRPVVPSKKDTK